MRSKRLSITLLALLVVSCTRFEGRAPDVVLVVLDTTRADRLGVYGNPRDVSPHLDRFAGGAMLFRNAWSTSSWTLPAHASLFTGLYPSAHGARMTPDVDPDSLGDNPAYLASSAVTLAELLAAEGYRTAAFAAAGWLAPEFGLLQGYEVQDAENLRRIRADEITDRAIAWLREVPGQEPLHLLVNYFDPHDPLDPPEGFDDYPMAKHPLEAGARSPEGGVELSPGQLAARLDRYDGEIRFMDHHLGRLFEALQRAGRYDRSLTIVTADHGEHFGEHGAIGHGAWLYEEVLHVPLLIRLPGGRDGGREIDAPVSLVDILPLVAEVVGIDLPRQVNGQPLGERRFVLAEESPSPLLVEMLGEALDRDLVSGIRWPWKLIVSSRGESELYRLDEDPNESNQLTNPSVEADLRQEIERILGSLEPTPPDPHPPPMSPETRARLKALGYVK
jgi:arylsulfatase A-like enzyme